MKYDFDAVINRRNTNSLKYDCAKRRGRPEDLLPMWVADMDFLPPDEVIKSLKKTADHGICGYSEQPDDYFGVVRNWFFNRFGWEPKEEWRVASPGVVFSIGEAMRAYTKEGDSILIQPPVYYPFRQMIVDNKRRLVTSPLISNNGYYVMDFDDIEAKFKLQNIKMMILCSPHNPVGRVWTTAELILLGRLCERYGVIVLSDEIHADFAYNGNHSIFFSAYPNAKNFAVVCTSPGKTFNIAGLQTADVWIPDKALRELYIAEHKRGGFSQLNTFGVAGGYAAYKYGEKWFDRLLLYLSNNRAVIERYILEKMPGVNYVKPEGTYLAWLDFRNSGLGLDNLDDNIISKAGLWLDHGRIFGAEGHGFERLNFACPTSVLELALESLSRIF